MSHEVESMMYVGETPWHRLGTKLDNPPTTREAMIAAGLDWSVGLEDLVTIDGASVDAHATYRESDGRILGVVGPSYNPIQNETAFAWFDPFLESGEASIECAGSLREGARIWVLAKLNRDPSTIVPGDIVDKYILLANSHDGTISGRVGFTPVRVVCANTMAMAVKNSASRLLRVRHTKNATSALNAIRDTMDCANADFEATADQFRALAHKSIHSDDLDKYVRLVFSRATGRPSKIQTAPEPVDGAELLGNLLERPVTERTEGESYAAVERSSRQFDLVKELFETGAGNQLPGVRGTMWAALNAVTEFTTHHRGRTGENRLLAQFNDGMLINQRALSAAMAMV